MDVNGARAGDEHRSSPRVTAVITGAGRGGWGTQDPISGVVGNVSRRTSSGSSGHGSNGSSSASVGNGEPDTVDNDVDEGKRGGNIAADGGAPSTGKGGDGDGPCAEGVDGRKAPSAASGRRVGALKRQGSMLWRKLGWKGAGETGAEGKDPTADRNAMEEAIAAGKGHVRFTIFSAVFF